MKTPVRWLDDPTLAADLRADLECVQEHSWQPDLDRAGTALDAALKADASPSAIAKHAAPSGGVPSALLPKLAVAAVSGCLIISASVWQLQTHPAQTAPDALAQSSQPAVQQAPVANSSTRREIEQLQRIYATLKSDPAQAYRLARASLAEIPHGPLREEREGLAVIALWQSGEHAPARALAQRFLARYPESPLRERIRQLLASEPSP